MLGISFCIISENTCCHITTDTELSRQQATDKVYLFLIVVLAKHNPKLHNRGNRFLA